ncbi:hypothetical protein QUB60_11815 [Microcoleus sp. A2-C5]
MVSKGAAIVPSLLTQKLQIVSSTIGGEDRKRGRDRLGRIQN